MSPAGQELFENRGSGNANHPQFQSNLHRRHRFGKVWSTIFQASTVVGILTLVILLLTIINKSFGYVVYANRVQPEELAVDGVPLENLPEETLITVLKENVSSGLFRKLGRDMPMEERTQSDIYNLIQENVIKPKVEATWTLFDSIFNRDKIYQEVADKYPDDQLKFTSWISTRFITSAQSPDPAVAGVRTAILGSLFTILITILFAFPLGVGAAIYLEEYASDNWINRILQTNINNLAGVPSIIYGMLGLAIFARTLVSITSGAAFGFAESSGGNGRTILSAGLTLALLVLPLLIINGQEAIRSVPNSLRQASYGLGASKWQTIWHHVLPNAIPGILTGTILSVSRAIGETAPLVVIGASTYISLDPSNVFSKFTTLPIQIYQWTARPQDEFRNIAAAAILVLLGMLLSLNAAAILLRNRYSQRLS